MAVSAPGAIADTGREFSFRSEAVIGPFEPGSKAINVFVPLARASDAQRVLEEKIEANIPGRIETEPIYGNRYWHGTIAESDGETVSVAVTTRVERLIRRSSLPTESVGLDDAQRMEQALFLGPNQRVVVGHEILDPILEEIAATSQSEDPAVRARATYDWVVDNVEYKKVGTGWGNGDTFWACNERYGNCTDFHALFISLARSQGIPARFEIGFPIPTDRSEGMVGGYHCWVAFYLPESGWFPIDASEAFKHPELREHFFGTHPADRIHLTTGRDLRLGEAHVGPALNYFVYPYVEVSGEPYEGPIEKTFEYSATAEAPAADR